MDEKELDVMDDSSTSSEGGTEVETKPQSDKDRNFAELRKRQQELEKENERLRESVRQQDLGSRSLVEKPQEEEERNSSEVHKVIFERDMKKAVKRWSEKNQVTPEEWAHIKKQVSLKGDELDDEIYEKIDTAYNSLPGVRQKREQELVKKAKLEAMREFQDDELDLGGGGDIDLGGGSEPRFTPKEKSWLNAFGVTPEERKSINKQDTSYKEWGTPRTAKK